MENLKHQDYSGKRIYLSIEDNYNNKVTCKIDIDVYKLYSIEQDEYCLEITSSNEGVQSLINSKE